MVAGGMRAQPQPGPPTFYLVVWETPKRLCWRGFKNRNSAKGFARKVAAGLPEKGYDPVKPWMFSFKQGDLTPETYSNLEDALPNLRPLPGRLG